MNRFFLHNFIPTNLLPHCLKFRVLLYFLAIIRPLNFIFMLCLSKHISPIFCLKLVLNLSYILVWIIKYIYHLKNKILSTYAFILLISTSSILSLITFSFNYASETNFYNVTLAWSNGTNGFLLPVYSYLGIFSFISSVILSISFFFILIKFFILSLACFSFTFTTSTFSMFDRMLFCLGLVFSLYESVFSTEKQIPIFKNML